ncbi:MAG: DUF3168 domain-containing protein [Pirellulales bacterium]|nr:DUF3168 domain-containing protein [Pirellulales bacterium]
MLEPSLHDYLTADADLAALVAGRIHMIQLPAARRGEVRLPALTIQRVATAPEAHQGGASNLGDATIQLDAWANEYGQAKAAAEAARLAMLRLATGGAIGRPERRIEVLHVAHRGEHDDPEPPEGGRAAGGGHVILEFDVRWRRAVPSP